jgi:hypothetical protein
VDELSPCLLTILAKDDVPHDKGVQDNNSEAVPGRFQDNTDRENKEMDILSS